MPLGARAWISAARLRRRLARRGGDLRWREELREDLIRRHAPGRSFADLGCMWGANGRLSFLAEESGAASVTAVDASPPTPEFEAEHARRSSKVRFVRGDLHDRRVYEKIGPHDVVWCTGVLYHSPHPMMMLQHFLSITKDVLILGSLTVPELPGVPQATVFFPHLDAAGRAPYARVWRNDALGISSEMNREPNMTYANYWFGFSPSALAALVQAAGFTSVETIDDPDPFNTHIVARRA